MANRTERGDKMKFLTGAKWRTRGAAIAVTALAVVGVGVVATPAQAYYTNTQRDFQVLTHIQNIGWTSTPGTRGQGLRLEAIQVTQLQ